jgi:hypothetical protein
MTSQTVTETQFKSQVGSCGQVGSTGAQQNCHPVSSTHGNVQRKGTWHKDASYQELIKHEEVSETSPKTINCDIL